MRHKILVVSYGGAHAETLLPLLKTLAVRPDIDLVVVGLTIARRYFVAHGIDALGLVELLDLCSIDKAPYVRCGARVVEDFNVALSPAVTDEESFLYYGIGWSDLVASEGERVATLKFQELGRKAFNPLKTCRDILDRLAPSLLVTTSSPRFERASVVSAGALGIPLASSFPRS